MKRVLVLGAGLVCRPLVRYLLNQPDFQVTVASRTVSKAQALIANHPQGKAVDLLADNHEKLESLIKDHDLAISLLPAPLHPVVAECCLRHRKHMVTTSYVSPKMQSFNDAARQADLILLNEIGVDPGIDHMSAMRVIHGVRERGGKVISFKSYCGGLPAPEANDNPWGYKFSWAPRGVCTAGKNSARYREKGKQLDVPGPELFLNHHPVPVQGVPGHSELEGYPNRDSLVYLDLYGLQHVETMFRGTLRYPGWCKTLKAVVDLGMLEETPVTYPAGMTFAQWTAGLINSDSPVHVRSKAAKFLKMDEKANPLDRMEWLGLFSNDPLPIVDQQTTALDILATRMNQKMAYALGERDMIVLLHRFVARFPDKPDEHISSTLIDFGQPDGDTSMARTVSLPAAVATRLILTGRIGERGVQVPVTPGIYEPVLNELESMNIRCVEKGEQ